MKQTRKTNGYVTLPAMAAVLQVAPAMLRKIVKTGKASWVEQGKKGDRLRVPVQYLRKALLPEEVLELLEQATPTVPQGLLTVPQAAKRLGVTNATVYLAIQQGKMARKNLNGLTYVDEEAIGRYDEYRKHAKEMRQVKFQLAQLEKKRKRLLELVAKVAA